MPALRAAVFYGLQRAYGPRPSGLCPLGTPTLAAEGSGCRGKSAPAPTHGGWGRSRRVKGPSPRPCGAAGRTNPLTRLPLETRHRATAGRLSGRGSRFAQRPRSGPDLDALERPQRSGLVVRGALPLTACHVANGQAPLGGRVSGGSKAKPRRPFVLLALWARTILRSKV